MKVRLIAHTPNPVYAIVIPIVPVIKAPITEILAWTLKSIFIVKRACWTIHNELITKDIAVTLISFESKFDITFTCY